MTEETSPKTIITEIDYAEEFQDFIVLNEDVCIEDSLKTEVEDKVKALKEILDAGSKEDLETKTKDLSDSLQKIGEQMYKQQEQPKAEEQAKSESQPNGEAKPNGQTKPEEPVEGEVVE